MLRERERERKKKPREEKLLCLLSGFFSFGFLHFNPSICFYLALGHCNYMGIGFTDCFVQSMERILRYQGNISLLGYTRICKIK